LSVNFATPVAHQTDGTYAAFTNMLVIGQPFQQPLVTVPNHSAGMELFLSSAGAVADIYAWLDSTLTWATESATAPGHRLVLAVRPDVAAALGPLRTLEPKPRRAVYENVDLPAVQNALVSILNFAHTQANANAQAEWVWHPCMRMLVRGDPVPRSLKRYLDAYGPAVETITQLVRDFINGAPGALLREIPVLAGERLGRAAPYLPGDVLPGAPPFPLGGAGDANRACRLTFVTEGPSGEPLDPLYYLHVLMRRMLLPPAHRVVISLTNTVQGGGLVHPLVNLYPALAAAAVPKARAQVDGAYRFPLGKLADWHGSPRPPAATVSGAEWRYAANGRFEARMRATGARIALPVLQGHRTKVAAFWNDPGLVVVTNQICAELQVPAELVVGLACTESRIDLSPRSIRFEPLDTGSRTALRNREGAAAHELAYDKVVGEPATVTGVANYTDTTTELTVAFAARRSLAENGLVDPISRELLVGDIDRLAISSNTGSGTAVTDYRISVRDVVLSGGSAPEDTQEPGTTLYYSLSRLVAGNAVSGPVETVVERDGRLRRMRIVLGQNTLVGAMTATIMRNGVATGITSTLAAGARIGTDHAHTEDLGLDDRIALRIETGAGGAGRVRGVGLQVQFAPAGAGDVYTLEGYSPPAPGVPTPYVGGDLVKPGSSTLTWAQMVEVTNATGGARVSPGLLQTLVPTAVGAVQYLRALDPGIFGRLGIPAPPAEPGQYMTDWLLDPRHSILLGAAYLRQAYVAKDTRFDLPYVGAAYNGGNTKPAPDTVWGFKRRRWDYPDRAARYFNAAVDLFNGAPAPATRPTVRFMS
jgi:hypothetical protein